MDLRKLEQEIMHTFKWNFNFQGPTEFIDRYLRILCVDKIRAIRNMSCQFCKFSLNESKFLYYRPSVLAACAVIIAVNVHKAEQYKTISGTLNKEKAIYFK